MTGTLAPALRTTDGSSVNTPPEAMTDKSAGLVCMTSSDITGFVVSPSSDFIGKGAPPEGLVLEDKTDAGVRLPAD